MEKWNVLWKLGYVLLAFIIYFILKVLRDWYYAKEKTKLANLNEAEKAWQKEIDVQIGSGKELLTRQNAVKLKKEVKRWSKYWHFVDIFMYGYFICVLIIALYYKSLYQWI